MNNETRPHAQSINRSANDGWIVWVAAALIIFSVGVYAGITAAAPSFEKLLSDFGPDVPALTRLVLAAAPFSILLSLVGIIPFVRLLRARRSGESGAGNELVWIFLSALAAVLLLGVFAYAMYLPIFKLGAVV